MSASGTLVLVNGNNLVDEVCRALSAVDATPGQGSFLAEYLASWFDIDRLLAASVIEVRQLSAVEDLGIIALHSNKELGPAGGVARDGEMAESFWQRQGGNPHSSCRRVRIPGAPRESAAGLNAAAVVHLFETHGEWRLGLVVTCDAELVPAVWALRQKGKRLLCCTLIEVPGSPLVAACQHHVPLNRGFLGHDFALARMYGPNGPIAEVLSHPELQGLSWAVDHHRLSATLEQREHDILRPLLETIQSGPTCFGFRAGTEVAFDANLNASGIDLGHRLSATPHKMHLEAGVTRHQQGAIERLLAARPPAPDEPDEPDESDEPESQAN